MMLGQSIAVPHVSDVRYCALRGTDAQYRHTEKMATTGSRDRTPFGRRLFEARRERGLTQVEVCKALEIRQSTLSELETVAHSSGYTAQLAAFYGADAHYLATGEFVPQPPAPSVKGIPLIVEKAFGYAAPPLLDWATLVNADLTKPFSLTVQDGALGPMIFPGCIARLEPGRAPEPGWPVLVKDQHGDHYLRNYQAGAAGRWQAVASAPGYAALDSVADGLTLVAVMRGFDRP